MNTLPTSIEAYLEEAGFSATDIIILRRLMTDDALTLRELASKTGKSVGALDASLKKLLQKGILLKETINESPKYRLQSMQAVAKWMEADMIQKREMIMRKFESFSNFISTIESEQKRPEMEHFEGLEGIKRAYTLLLERGRDFVRYGPPPPPAEEDPLRDFRVQYFRERHKRGIFSRVITHDTPLGRRFHSRDHFEYRTSILVDPDAYPFRFEKIIAGDTVACFQHEDLRACFIRYPELANEERTFFERIWNKKTKHEEKKQESFEMPPPLPPGPPEPQIITIPVKTRTLSQLREFFLSRKSIATFVLCAVLAGGLTYGLYRHNLSLNTKRIQERVKSIAATGALQFKAEDLNELRTLEDVYKPQYAKVNYQLNEIRRQNEGVAYVYLMRPHPGSDIWEFISDADSANPFAVEDLNADGQITEFDEKNYPGVSYDITQSDPPVDLSLIEPTAFAPETDQWGTVIAAWAPIRDAQNQVVAVLGVDIFADEVQNLTRNTFLPVYYFFGFFFLFVLIRMAAFNRSLFKEVCELIKIKKVIIISATCAVVALAITYGFYHYNIRINTERIREKITSIAATGALQFEVDDLDKLQTLDDIDLPEYGKVTKQLDEIRKQNDQIVYVYILRPTDRTNIYEFVADADAIDPFSNPDTNRDGIVDEADTLGLPGLEYEVTDKDALITGTPEFPIANEEPYTDQWGTFFTGYAPIRNASGATVALLSVDMWGDEVYKMGAATFAPVYVFIFFFGLFIVFRLPLYKNSFLHQLLKGLTNRK